jgi:hypothetical protein
MTTVEIAPLENGAHRNQTGNFRCVPEGWAILPEDMEIPASFPFVDIIVEDGIVAAMTEREVPAPEPMTPVPTPEERLAQLEKSNTALSAQLQASITSNAMLEECLIEMAGIVYA